MRQHGRRERPAAGVLHHADSVADHEPAGGLVGDRRRGPRVGASATRSRQQRGSMSSGDRIQVEAGVLYALINHRQDDHDAGYDARDTFTGGTGHFPF